MSGKQELAESVQVATAAVSFERLARLGYLDIEGMRYPADPFAADAKFGVGRPTELGRDFGRQFGISEDEP